MRWMKWLGVASAIILIIACFLPWVSISFNYTVSGTKAENINLGKPGYLHFLFIFFFLVFTLIPKVWAKRANLLVAALNMAWAIRNYFVFTACHGGECPEKQAGIYLIIPVSVLMLLSALFPDLKLKGQKT